MAQWVKNPPAMQDSQESQVQFLGQENPLEEEMATPPPYSCLENPTDRGDWWAIVHRVAKSQTSGLAHIQFSNTHNKYVQQDINFERQILFEGN